MLLVGIKPGRPLHEPNAATTVPHGQEVRSGNKCIQTLILIRRCRLNSISKGKTIQTGEKITQDLTAFPL